MKPPIILMFGFLVIAVITFSIAGPQGLLLWQWSEGNQPSPTPTPTNQGGKTPLHRQSGETKGLKIGAAVIVLIILGGILIQETESSPKNK